VSVTLNWIGLQELRDALKELPDVLVEQATTKVTTAADDAAAEVIAAYPEVTGNLKAHVKVDGTPNSRGGVYRRVRSTARHAHLYEFGHMTRQPTIAGKTRRKIAGANVFIPIMKKRRARMYEDLIDVVESQGLDVRR
jgi:hypothetical protein